MNPNVAKWRAVCLAKRKKRSRRGRGGKKRQLKVIVWGKTTSKRIRPRGWITKAGLFKPTFPLLLFLLAKYLQNVIKGHFFIWSLRPFFIILVTYFSSCRHNNGKVCRKIIVKIFSSRIFSCSLEIFFVMLRRNSTKATPPAGSFISWSMMDFQAFNLSLAYISFPSFVILLSNASERRSPAFDPFCPNRIHCKGKFNLFSLVAVKLEVKLIWLLMRFVIWHFSWHSRFNIRFRNLLWLSAFLVIGNNDERSRKFFFHYKNCCCCW